MADNTLVMFELTLNNVSAVILREKGEDVQKKLPAPAPKLKKMNKEKLESKGKLAGEGSNSKNGDVGGVLCSKKSKGWQCPGKAAANSTLCENHIKMGRRSRIRARIKNSTIDDIVKYLIDVAVQEKANDKLAQAYEKIAEGVKEAKEVEVRIMAGENAEDGEEGEEGGGEPGEEDLD